jgi:hypothetical protein
MWRRGSRHGADKIRVVEALYAGTELELDWYIKDWLSLHLGMSWILDGPERER